MADNKLIMKNTLYMAVRMFLTMAVTLYTSRVVLAQLGVTDFGIYSVVGGLTIMMSFFTTSLVVAMQRYMNVELAAGTSDDGLQKVFGACWCCLVMMVGAFLLIAEVGGVWFLENELSFPEGKLPVARIVFQLSLVNAIFELIRTPYNSLIIAHEKMSFYAWNSILEVGLKLTTAICLSITPGNKLLIYMYLLIGVAVLINISYILYCRSQFPEIRFSFKHNKGQVREIGSFAGWNVLTSISDISWQQGSSMILNIFYGVALNATMGIANQVKGAVMNFTRSVQTASNPQIIKLFAAKQYDEFLTLFERISRISFFILLGVGIPIILNAPYILSIWLTVIPPHGVLFVRLMVVFCIIDSLVGPLWVSMQAVGRIAAYQIVVSVMWILCLPLCWLAFHYGLPAYWLILILITIDFVLLWVRVGFSAHYCGFTYGMYIARVCLPIAATSIASLVAPVAICFTDLTGFALLAATCATWLITFPTATYLLGITHVERSAIRKKISKYFKSYK